MCNPEWDNYKPNISDETFITAVNSINLKDLEFGDLIGVSGPTIHRWREGKNLPYNAIREAVLEFVKNR